MFAVKKQRYLKTIQSERRLEEDKGADADLFKHGVCPTIQRKDSRERDFFLSVSKDEGFFCHCSRGERETLLITISKKREKEVRIDYQYFEREKKDEFSDEGEKKVERQEGE